MKKMLFIITLLLSQVANATFVPANNKQFPVQYPPSVYANGVTKDQFKKILSKVNKVYGPIVAQHGGYLQIRNKWEDDTANSNTDEVGSLWYVNAFGGLARHPKMTPDGYMMVLCHELYHHLGGFPKYQGEGVWTNNASTHWASNEGQSDYGAALKCFKRMVENDKDINSRFNKCNAGREEACCKKPPYEAQICVRTVRAGISVSNVLHDLAEETYKIDLNTPDKTVVKQTYDAHPNAQCRMDTYYAGAICDADINEEFSDVEPKQGSCSKEAGDKIGVRPLCWYAPLSSVKKPAKKPTRLD